MPCVRKRSSHKAILRKEQDFSVATSPGSRTVTPCLPSRHWRSLLAPFEDPMYHLFYDGEEPPKLPNLSNRKNGADNAWGSNGKDARVVAKFCRLFSRMEKSDLGLVLFMAQKMARRKADR